MRYELIDREWFAIKPLLPNKPRGVPRVDDRRVPNGICWVLRSSLDLQLVGIAVELANAPWRLSTSFYSSATLGHD